MCDLQVFPKWCKKWIALRRSSAWCAQRTCLESRNFMVSFPWSTTMSGCCLVFLVCSSRLDVVLVGCAWCQLTEVTKDCRGPPAPTSHTHRDPVALSVRQPGAPMSSKDCAHGSDVLFRSRWYRAPTRWVSGSLCDAMQCRYGAETKTLGKHLNSSAGYFPTWRPVTMHAWEFAFLLRL